jgi:hypothetical protein
VGRGEGDAPLDCAGDRTGRSDLGPSPSSRIAASHRRTEAVVDPARLRKIPVFSDLDDDEPNRVAALAAARVERDGAHIADLRPRDVVGELAVLERSQRNATVRATSPREHA